MSMETMQITYTDDLPVEQTIPAVITQAEWDAVRKQVADIHSVMKSLGEQVGPMVEKMQSGGIFGMLSGLRGR